MKTTRDGLETYNNCVNKLNIPDDDVLKIETISDPLNRQILKCVYNDIGFYEDGKGFRVDRIVKQLGGGAAVENVVNRCVPVDSNDPVDVDVQIIEIEECFKTAGIGEYRD